MTTIYVCTANNGALGSCPSWKPYDIDAIQSSTLLQLNQIQTQLQSQQIAITKLTGDIELLKAQTSQITNTGNFNLPALTQADAEQIMISILGCFVVVFIIKRIISLIR